MNNHPILIIRADANSRMGTGHVMRCIALGQVWQDAGGCVVFMTACQNEKLLQRLRDEQFSVVVLKEPTDFLPELGKRASEGNATWIVLDGYHFDLPIQQSVRTAGYKLLMVDDYNHQPAYECDILLNQNVDSGGLNYSINSEAQKLRGTNFTMLRREFRSGQGLNRTFPDLGKNILITLGGADPDNLSLKVIQALQTSAIPELHVKVVVGPANRHLEGLEEVVEASNLQIELLSSVQDMTPLMHWADLAISAGGSTCWEFCCLGVPFLTIVIADNQRGLSNELSKQGVAPCLGEAPSCNSISETVCQLLKNSEQRQALSLKARELVDGFGVDRVLYRAARDAGLDLFATRLSFRRAVAEDAERLWHWANDPSVRSQCYNTEVIPWESHRDWFSRRITAPDVLILLLELDGCPVGQIRYDQDGEVAHIGFSIDRKFRGLGLGARMVLESIGLAHSALNVETIQAEVFADNAASNGVFTRCGFEFVKETEIKGVLSNVFVKERE